MGIASEDAARLQTRAEQWQDLAVGQQQLAMRLGKLISEQRALTEEWARNGDEVLARSAIGIEATLREVYDDMLAIEEAVLRRVAAAVDDAGRVVRAR